MESHRRTTSAAERIPARVLFLTAFLLLVTHASAQAQTRRGEHTPHPPPPTSNPDTRTTRHPSIRERQNIMLEMEKEAAKPPTPDQVELALAQIGADYERLQVINNRMMSAAMTSTTPDYKNISETTEEIGKRAARLKGNLSLPKPIEEEKRPAYRRPEDAAQMKAALLELDRSIMTFVKSPLFKNPEVIDAQAGARARRDLEDIIELSRLISRDAERLGKNSKKP